MRLSRSEVNVVQRLQRLATQWEPLTTTNHTPTQWFIEPGAENSPTLALAKNALLGAQSLLARPDSFDTNPISIGVGRSQTFLKNTVAALNCRPNLDQSAGYYIMGATLCLRRVITINLTGYFFIYSLSDIGNTANEKRAEPAISATSYLIVDRNISSLAHEWTHVARALPTEGHIALNEPAWLREGMAEIVSGLSRVKASQGKMTFLEFHVIRMRKFSNWPNHCRLSLTQYRLDSTSVRGCEYLRGAAAVEVLLANYGGLLKVMQLYDDAHHTGDFYQSFRNIYGISMRTFEIRADNYAKLISQAATYQPH